MAFRANPALHRSPFGLLTLFRFRSGSARRHLVLIGGRPPRVDCRLADFSERAGFADRAPDLAHSPGLRRVCGLPVSLRFHSQPKHPIRRRGSHVGGGRELGAPRFVGHQHPLAGERAIGKTRSLLPCGGVAGVPGPRSRRAASNPARGRGRSDRGCHVADSGRWWSGPWCRRCSSVCSSNSATTGGRPRGRHCFLAPEPRCGCTRIGRTPRSCRRLASYFS